MSKYPGIVMNQIRNSVRALSDSPHIDMKIDSNNTGEPIHNHELLQNNHTILTRLKQRVSPNMPVAFIPGRLVSRFVLGKWVVPFRKIGARLFTKWYVDAYTQQQKHLNQDVWYGINSLIELVDNQNQLINALLHKQEGITQLQEDLKAIQRKSDLNGFKYSDFASRFSASEEVIKENYRPYISNFEGCRKVLDIGCGRGYFLELLTEAEIEAVGVDSDPELIAECKRKGLTAYVDDGNTFLDEQEDNSFNGIFAGHIIEHLNLVEKLSFLRSCYSKLDKNGVLLIETPNTTSVYVMHNLYYLDPTHEKPLFPEALKHLAEMVGFKVSISTLSGQIPEKAPIDYYNFTLILTK